MKWLGIVLAVLFIGCGGGGGDKYPLHKNITVTNFYVGELASSDNGYIPNVASAWDDIWMWDYGGIDSPNDRNASYPYYPAKFIPTENPFYFALPYNDLDENGKPKPSQKEIPWYRGPTNTTILKNRWIKIIKTYDDGTKKVAYAQWEDVGPFGEDDFDYVFGNAKPKNQINDNAGLDVSPAVKIYLGLKDIDKIDWQFVDDKDVPEGPWKKIVTKSGVNWLDMAEIKKEDTFYWQLQGDLREDIPASVYDIDLFDTSSDTIASLKTRGIKVICYMNAGAWEEWRSDADEFPQNALGNDLEGWDGEKWLDIRNKTVREIMKKRMDLAVEKGCDGIEPDNIDGYQNDTGFDLSYDDQFDYNRFLTVEAKKRGLVIAMKNDLDQAEDLATYFDFLLNEQGIEYGETSKFAPFINQNKAVFDVEYNDTYYDCSLANGFHLLLLPIDLNGSFVKSCDYGDY